MGYRGQIWHRSAPGMSFLDMIVRQVEYTNTAFGADVPLVLMNSFNTHEETVNIIHKYRKHNLTIHTFNQSCYPFIFRESLQPVPSRPFGTAPTTSNSHDPGAAGGGGAGGGGGGGGSGGTGSSAAATGSAALQGDDERDYWYPPGHGDVFFALFQSGLLENLVDQGKEYICLNVDNLGATINLDIMFHLMNSELEFMAEVTDRTKREQQAVVGGHVLAEVDGRLGSVGYDKLADVERNPRGREQYNFYNTNNLWVSLRAIQRLVAQDSLHMDVSVNELSVHGMPVVQLERAAGTAMQHFEKSAAVNVPRARPSREVDINLFIVQSNLYGVKYGCLEMRPDLLSLPIPMVNSSEFESLDDYWSRIPRGIPNIMGLEQLTVSGDVVFGTGITLRGTVIIIANEGSRIDLPDGSTLENKVVTGDLRIFDH